MSTKRKVPAQDAATIERLLREQGVALAMTKDEQKHYDFVIVDGDTGIERIERLPLVILKHVAGRASLLNTMGGRTRYYVRAKPKPKPGAERNEPNIAPPPSMAHVKRGKSKDGAA